MKSTTAAMLLLVIAVPVVSAQQAVQSAIEPNIEPAIPAESAEDAAPQSPRSPSDRPVPPGAQATDTEEPGAAAPTPPAPAPPPLPTPEALTAGLGGLGATPGTFSASPTMIGDLFGSGLATFSGTLTVRNQVVSQGFLVNQPSSQNRSDAILAFGANGGAADDFFSNGIGIDASGDGLADTFAITEPQAPNDVPTSPGPGFGFDGGTAVYTNAAGETVPRDGAFSNGDLWLISYSFTGQFTGGQGQGVVIAGPDVASRRVKLSENFSPETQDRYFMNYSFFNDAIGGLGDISRWVWGAERRIGSDDISLEIRVPTAATYGSTQDLNAVGDRRFELGNITLASKFVLLRTQRTTWSTGLGIALPIADDARLVGGGNELLRIENEGVHLLPYTGMLYRLSRNTILQTFTQFDFNTNGNPVLANLTGGPLNYVGAFNASTLMYADVAINHTLHRGRRNQGIRSLIANLELHYSTTLQDADVVNAGGIVLTDLSNRFDILNLTSGLHIQLGENLVVTPAIAVPLRSGLDEQFDYEAMVQVNYFN